MTRVRLALAAAAAAGALLAALAASDVRSWDRALARGDARFAETPVRARWAAKARVPGDPARRLLSVGDDLALRRAVQAFVAAEATPRGFDNGERRALARAAAEVALADVAAAGSAAQSSQASDLLGVLVSTAGRAGGLTAEERARAAFEAAVRADPANMDAKYNLELLVRRSRATGTREGPGTGSGSSSRGRRGAGSGTPGQGY